MAENTENKEVTSRKQKVLDRLKATRPELNPDNEEELFGAIDDDFDDFDDYRTKMEEGNQKVLDWLDKDEKNAAMLVSMMNGGNLVEELVKEYGDDLSAALEDPDNAEKLAQASKAYHEKVLQSKQFDEEAAKNMEDTFKALDEAQAAAGVDEETTNKAFELYCNIINDAIVNKVSADTWGLFIKAVTHDQDVEEAGVKGELKGRNAKIKDLQSKTALKEQEHIPPVLEGQSGAKAIDRPKEDYSQYGVLGRVGSPDVYERGGLKRM
jgi:hypothetical protein